MDSLNNFIQYAHENDIFFKMIFVDLLSLTRENECLLAWCVGHLSFDENEDFFY